MKHVMRFQRTPELALDGSNALWAGHWRKTGFEEAKFFQAFPPTASAADGDIGITAAQVA
jgi:hypothetical protein